MEQQILVINPGSTSTKIAVYKADPAGASNTGLAEVFISTIRHSTEELAPYPRVLQYKFREDTILGELAEILPFADLPPS